MSIEKPANQPPDPIDELFKNQERVRRSKMSPEEIIADNKKKAEAEDFFKYYALKEKLETGTPEEQASAQKELNKREEKNKKLASEIKKEMELKMKEVEKKFKRPSI